MPPWSQLLLLLPAWLAMGWLITKASWFWQHNPDLQFGWIVVLLCAYLFWEAWEKRPALRPRLTPGSAVVAVSGLGFLFLTQVYQAAYGLTAASMSGLAAGAMLVVVANLAWLYGTIGVWHFAFAFGFLLVALPIPSVIYGPLVSGLQSKVATVNVEVLKLIGIPAEQVGSLIRLPNCTVGIDEACSGIRSLQSTVMATLFIGYLTLKHQGVRTVLFVLGIALAILGNVGRSLFLSLTANAKGTSALEGVHDTAGWSVLAFTVVGVAGLAWLLHRLETGAARTSNASPSRKPELPSPDATAGAPRSSPGA